MGTPLFVPLPSVYPEKAVRLGAADKVPDKLSSATGLEAAGVGEMVRCD